MQFPHYSEMTIFAVQCKQQFAAFTKKMAIFWQLFTQMCHFWRTN